MQYGTEGNLYQNVNNQHKHCNSTQLLENAADRVALGREGIPSSVLGGNRETSDI